ncbi:hypothetical protein [Pseudomonas wadenswilerensis]|uniref:hypothetical protein n=1 Tax=Pseudomonas wadenswilerensis TaxID=1785161 RepID=UPI00215EEF9B|nr:hypothetical protein [Pseudomonas wadenswilerensis]UVM24490.1 hypothetical protein LOY45_13315 [Pseudomonas wadenswilerensis]
MKTHKLYRAFDATGRLLYIGITMSPLTRLSQHLRTSHWSGDIARIDIECYRSQALAREAEKAAIEREAPLFNINHQLPDRTSSCAKSGRKVAARNRAFDVRHVSQNIRDVAAILSRISIAAPDVKIEGDLPSSTFLRINFTLPNSVYEEELGLNELFDVLPVRPAPSRNILLVTGIDVLEQRDDATVCQASMIAPWWLTHLCTSHLGNRDDFDEAYPTEILPSISTYNRVIQYLGSRAESHP